MAQDRGSVAPRVDMVEAERPGVRRRQVQLTAQIPQALGAGSVLARRETAMGPEEPKLEGDPDPADEVESFDECDVVDVQAPGLDQRSIKHARFVQPKSSDLCSTDDGRQHFTRSLNVLQDVHICTFGPFSLHSRGSGNDSPHGARRNATYRHSRGSGNPRLRAAGISLCTKRDGVKFPRGHARAFATDIAANERREGTDDSIPFASASPGIRHPRRHRCGQK